MNSGDNRPIGHFTAVMERHPESIRIIRSDQSDEKNFLSAVHYAHQFLSAFVNVQEMQSTLTRAIRVRDLLSNPQLRKLVSGVKSLPCLPALYVEVVEELRSSDPSISRIARSVANDLGMTTKALQIVNSVAFGVRFRIDNPLQATVYLGLNMIKALVLSERVFSQSTKEGLNRFRLKDLSQHSTKVGLVAKKICLSQGVSKEIAKDAFMAGLLHDIGQLILAFEAPDNYIKVIEIMDNEEMPRVKAEQMVFGTSHAEVGAYLIGLWGLSDSLISSIQYHHQPSLCPVHAIGPLAGVHLANAMEHESRGFTENAPRDEAYLAEIGLGDFEAPWEDAVPS